jgi:hypothetical protein
MADDATIQLSTEIYIGFNIKSKVLTFCHCVDIIVSCYGQDIVSCYGQDRQEALRVSYALVGITVIAFAENKFVVLIPGIFNKIVIQYILVNKGRGCMWTL